MFAILRKTFSLPIIAHAGLAVASIAWFQWTKGKLDASYAASNHPVDYMTGQTSFSGETIKGYYAEMTEAGTLDVYLRTQLLDYAFILGFLAIGLFVCTLLGRLSREGSFGRKASVLAGAAIIIGGICDAIENGWSFVMLANPASFADWLALPYSGFAVLKIAFIGVGMGLLLVSILSAGLGRALGRPKVG